MSLYFFFFFQAEDGIRDPLVTGVQTCALPILPTPKTYAAPWLSVRTVQPSNGLRWLLLAAGVTWCSSQVVPPSWETATFSGAGSALPFSCPRKLAQQT